MRPPASSVQGSQGSRLGVQTLASYKSFSFYILSMVSILSMVKKRLVENSYMLCGQDKGSIGAIRPPNPGNPGNPGHPHDCKGDIGGQGIKNPVQPWDPGHGLHPFSSLDPARFVVESLPTPQQIGVRREGQRDGMGDLRKWWGEQKTNIPSKSTFRTLQESMRQT
jgi:hypothetical protein